MRYGRLLATALLGAALMGATEAQAVFTVDVEQVGANVVATGSGAIFLSGLTFASSGGGEPGVEAEVADIELGAAGNLDIYTGFAGPANFGGGSVVFADSGTGDAVVMDGGVDVLGLPVGYVSGSALSDTAVFDNATFASLGLTAGTYTWTWGSPANGNADSFVLDIVAPAPAAPEPATLALLGAGLAALGAVRRRKSM